MSSVPSNVAAHATATFAPDHSVSFHHQPSAGTSQNAFFRVQTDIISVHPPPPKNGAENGVFHLLSPAGQFRYPPPPVNWGLLSSMKLILINQALAHPKMRFSGSRPTEFPFIQPPKRCRKWGFSPREPSRALQAPPPPSLRLLNSIISQIPINQALRHPEMRFWESRPTEFLFIHPPKKTVPKMGFFTS